MQNRMGKLTEPKRNATQHESLPPDGWVKPAELKLIYHVTFLLYDVLNLKITCLTAVLRQVSLGRLADLNHSSRRHL